MTEGSRSASSNPNSSADAGGRGGESTELSWDNAREEAPARPRLTSSVADIEYLQRPTRAVVALILVISAVLIAVILMVVAGLRVEDLTESLVNTLPEDVIGEYSDADVSLSAEVMLVAMGGLVALLLLTLVMNVRSLVVRRSGAARISFVIMLCLYLPVAAASLVVLDAAPIFLLVACGHGLGLLAALFLVCTPRVGQWLRQEEQPRMIRLEPGDSPSR